MFSKKFVSATKEYNTFEKRVPAPLMRKTFFSDCETTAKITVSACGFYDIYFNSNQITKGFFAPYISNLDDYLYYDEYEVHISEGINVVAFILGNGFNNNPGGYIWDFDTAPFRSAPSVAFLIEFVDKNGKNVVIEGDESVKVAPSAILSDDYRFFEIYDARNETDGWNGVVFDDSAWKNAVFATVPRGEPRICEAEPIKIQREIKPVSITKEGDSFVYDFGENCAGVCRLCVRGKRGQKIEFCHGERLVDGKFDIENIWFKRDNWDRDIAIIHKDVYICKGQSEEVYVPRFTYHGFQYVKVTGITQEQATESLLTYLVLNSDIKERGSFVCSDETLNELQGMTRRSDLANFYYFPTDCPQREKNGWTADAAYSAEHMILNLTVENSYREWMRNICKSQKLSGDLPGIVPTTGWGYTTGPCWDSVIAQIPYNVYKYTGDISIIEESAANLMRYLHFVTTKINSDGLIDYGLGDWCTVGRDAGDYKCPRYVSVTIAAMTSAKQIATLFNAVNMPIQRDFALAVAEKLRNALREKCIDFNTMTVSGNCQTAQATAIYFDVFENAEKPEAFRVLLKMIKRANDHMDVGFIGASVLFRVLSDFGYTDLAYKLITRKDFPSYANWIERGATSLWEDFLEEGVDSMNHHFWGDISAWFISYVGGIRFNPTASDIKELNISPCFISPLNFAEAYFNSPSGKINVRWERNENNIILCVKVPEDLHGEIILKNDYLFENGKAVEKLRNGYFTIINNIN